MRKGSAGRYRGNVEIVRDLLGAARDGLTKYEIWRRTGMSYEQFERYVKPLTEMRYLEKRDVGRHKIFKTTSEGLEVLPILNKASIIMKGIRERLK